MSKKVVIVDDEQDAVSSLSLLMKEFIEGAHVAGTASNAIEALKTIQQHKPDVVLLDIDMPNGNGFELLEAIPGRKFKVIFTTASSEFALKALKVKAEDYLLKPIDPGELQDALNRIHPTLKEEQKDTIPLPDQNGYIYVKVKEIIHLDGDGNYTTVYCTGNRKLVVSKNIKYFEDLLEPYPFFRCHQSHIINPSEVKQLKKNEGVYVMMSNGNRVDVSRSNKDALIRLLNG